MPVHSSAMSTSSSLCGSSAGILDRGDFDLVAVDDHVVAVDLHFAGEAAVHAVVAQQMRVGFDRTQIVHADDLDVVRSALHDGAQDQTPDAAEAVDRDANSHVLACS